MLRILAITAVLAAATNSAPAPDAHPLIGHQYVLISPQAAHHPLHYEQPILKLQQPLFQQISPLGRLETPQKQQLLVLYPNGPLTQYPLISLRQDGGTGGAGAAGGTPEWLAGLQNWWENLSGAVSQPGETPQSPDTSTGKIDKTILEKEALAMAPPALAPAMLPASTLPLMMDNRFYVISGQPQFYGNYDALRTPLNPVVSLQPLQAIRARASEGSIQAESQESIVAANQAVAPQELLQIPSVVPLQAGESFQLRSNFNQPLQPLVVEQVPQVAPIPEEDEPAKEAGRVLVNEPSTPENDESPKEFNRYMLEARSQANADMQLIEQLNLRENHAAPMTLSDDPTVAQAKPSGIALAGKGGVASAKPFATALTGDGGLALSSPSATAIAGDFGEENDDTEDKTKAE